MIPILLAFWSAHGAPQDPSWMGRTNYYGATDEQSVYEIKQDDVTLDFKGGILLSGKPVNPDRGQLTGTGLLLQGRRNVTIKNLTVKGYRFNIRLVNCENVRLENCQASSSRTLRIAQDGRPLHTFLNVRDTEAWRGYGAGIWVEKSKGITVTRCSANDAQNGLVLVDTTKSAVFDNDFSFNSGWGVALGRSSENTIAWNKADFCNRPWSGGWGGDSAGIAVADASHGNYFVGNSLTHSGDGFFLTHRAEQPREAEREIKILGASNDNVIAYNDGSWSTVNAFEGTFSIRNVYFKNWANASAAAGFWLGYSEDSLVLENQIIRNGTYGIAIEHGRRNVVEQNVLEGTKGTAVALWTSDDWRKVARPSQSNDLLGNKLKGNDVAFDLRNSEETYVKDESESASRFRLAAAPANQERRAKFERAQMARIKEILALRPKEFRYHRESDLPKGIGWLQLDDWAPRRFSGQLAAWRQPDPGSVELYLTEPGIRVAAPNMVRYEPTPEDPRLVRISTKSSPDEPGQDQPIQLNLATTNGKRRQVVNVVLRTGVWSVKWFAWPDLAYDDRDGWKALLGGTPILAQTARVLGGDFTGRAPAEGVPPQRFAMVATTKVKLDPGKYILSALSDDGIRVFVDGEEVISRWNRHGPTPDEATVSFDGKVHEIRVEYCQETGSGVLRLDWRKIS